MKKDVERLVLAKLAEVIGKSYEHPSGDSVRFSEVAGGLLGKTEVGEDFILEGMKVELLEESDEVKLVREVMEEPQTVLQVKITLQLPMELKYVHLDLEAPGASLLPSPSSSVVDPASDPTAFETKARALTGDRDGYDVVLGEIMSGLAVSPDDAVKADPGP